MEDLDIYSTSSYKMIYIFAIPDDAHKNMVKVGDATIHTTRPLAELEKDIEYLKQVAEADRIKHYTFTAGIKVDMLHCEIAVREKKEIVNNKEYTYLESFRDYNVADVLKNSGILSAYPNGIKAKEWYICSSQVAKNAIKAVKERRSILYNYELVDSSSNNVLNNNSSHSENKPDEIAEVIELREEQKFTVDKTLDIFTNNNRALWNCKMRFGKTLTAYEVVKEGNFQKTIIVTHRPVVQKGWEEEHSKIFGKDSKHIFLRKQNLTYSEDSFDYSSDVKNDIALNNLKKNNDSFTYFASMQDLRGSKLANGKFDKNKSVFAMDWDLIIYDEAHEGTQTELGQTVQSLLESPKNGKIPKILELSGTPYNIMDKFDDNICTWDYVMEQEAKRDWHIKHPNEPNPYADMPQMNIFTFDICNALENSYRYESETSSFNFREFFRVWTGIVEKDYEPIPEGCKIGDFVHKEDVKAFLDLITTDSENTKYPFATDNFRKEFKHTFWILPGVKEAKALSKMLQKHAVFSHYKIINVAGEGDEEMPYDNALSIVNEGILKSDYTITLSCGKLTTGVTVKEWTAVMMLTGSSSTDAKGYMQTIFRVQSAGCVDGKQKENCYVFDFAPDRALKVIADVHQISRGNLSEGAYKDELGKFINFCPVLAVNGTKMIKYEVNNMVRQIKRISVDNALKSGFDDESIYKVDTGIIMDEKDQEFFNMLKNKLTAQKKAKKDTSIDISKNGMSKEEYEVAKRLERKPKKELTDEERAVLEKLREQKKQRTAFIALLRNISIRLPLLIYGADVPLDENITLEKFIEIVDPESWLEFMPDDVTTDIFRRSIKYFDEDVLIGAGLRIRRLAKQADEYPPLERIKRITELFSHFRNPDKETVLTPWSVANLHLTRTIGGYTLFNDDFNVKNQLEEARFIDNGDITKEVLNKDSKVLEINSKSGVYPLYVAYSIFKNIVGDKEKEMSVAQQYEIWNKVITQNVFVLCKTQMAKSITQRTLAGFTDIKCLARYQPHLLERMKDDSDWVVKKLSNPENWGLQGEKMKFNAIVGNPPYQGINHSQIYPYFYLTSRNLTDKYVSLIFPTGWQEPKNANNLSKLNNEEIKTDRQIVYIDNRQNVFPGISGAEWTNIILWQKNYDNGLEGLQKVYTNGENPNNKMLIWDVSFIEKPKAIVELSNIVTSSSDFKSIQNVTSSRKPFGIPTNIDEVVDKLGFEYLRNDHKSEDDIAVYCKGNHVVYIPKESNIPKNNKTIDKYKVFVAYAWGNMSENVGLGGAFSDVIIANPHTICTETYLVSGCFDNKEIATKHAKYLMTKFLRALLYVNKFSQHSTTSWGAIPLQDYSEDWWNLSIAEINDKLFEKYNVPDNIKEYVNKNIQTRTESNIINYK